MKSTVKLVVIGLLMGAAEVVPGVSGGTIAFVSGIYARLVGAIKELTPLRLLSVRKVGVRQLWQDLDLNFLFVLFGSMAIAVLLFARGVGYLLEFHGVGIWSFFFGLVVTSIFIVGRELKPINIELILAVALGSLLAVVVTRFSPIESEVTPFVLFTGGCIAVCAWILPGLSGSFVLLILGLYHTVINAVKNFDVVSLTYVALGCVVGLLSFSRIISVLLARYRRPTIAVLIGFMVGSLVKIWPWKHTTSYQITSDGHQVPIVQEPVLPHVYEYITQQDPELVLALVAFIAGCALILVLDRLSVFGQGEKPVLAKRDVGDDT